MPVLHKIVIQDFRNIELQDLSFSPNINCIWGGNGEGKTNLLDAIHYLSMMRSGTQSIEKFNFRQGTSSFAIGGEYDMGNGDMSRFSIKVTEGAEKKLKRDDKPCTRISDHIGLLPIVMVSPADTSLVSESGDGRRRFANAFISQMDRGYLTGIQHYNRLLAQRNMLLKEQQPDVSLLEAIDGVMAPIADAVYQSRKGFCAKLLDVVQRYYEAISGGRETVCVEYRSDLSKTDFAALQAAHRERDLAMRFTVSGLHRDDFLFTLNGLPLRRCGSQGQQKSFLVALKFAQYEIMKLAYGFPPMLLLDDLFDKLDMTRAGNLLQMVAGNDFGQIFISDTDRNRSASLVDSITADRAYFKASHGTFSQIDGQLQD